MKFWQKTFLCIIIVFLAAFDILAYLMIQKSYEISRQREIQTAENEYYIINNTMTERLNSVSQHYQQLNSENIVYYVMPYVWYYADQNICFEVSVAGEQVDIGTEGQLLDYQPQDITPGFKFTQFYRQGDKLYLLIGNFLNVDETPIRLTYIKDVSSLLADHQQRIEYAVKIAMIGSGCLSVCLMIMLIGLTRPIRKLNQAAEEITKGNYDKRVRLASHDEIGEFAANFNQMVDHVEEHIKKLSEHTEAKQRFIDDFSHEMRTPMAAVIGYGELLKTADINEEQRLMAINYVISEGNRLQNLSKKLLMLSSMQQEDLLMEPVILRDVIDRVIDSLAIVYRDKQIRFEITLTDEQILGNADLLESLFQNLLENAARALSPNGTIVVDAELTEQQLGIIIADDGIGIPSDQIDKVMEPFYRIDKVRSRASGGAGLGLSICQRICQLHQAELIVKSDPQVPGTIVKVLFGSQSSEDKIR